MPVILIVDNEEKFCKVIKASLELENLTAEYRTSGEAAFEFLQHHPVDVVISDLRMDGMDGTLAYGRGKYQALLKKYIGCNAADWWPGMTPRPVPWGLPEWKLRADEDEVRI